MLKEEEKETFLCLPFLYLKRRGNVFTTFQLSDLKSYLRKIKSLSEDLENQNYLAFVLTSLTVFGMTWAIICAPAESLTGRILNYLRCEPNITLLFALTSQLYIILRLCRQGSMLFSIFFGPAYPVVTNFPLRLKTKSSPTSPEIAIEILLYSIFIQGIQFNITGIKVTIGKFWAQRIPNL